MSQVTRAQDDLPDSNRRQLIQQIEDEGTVPHLGQDLGAIGHHWPEPGSQSSGEDGGSDVGKVFHLCLSALICVYLRPISFFRRS